MLTRMKKFVSIMLCAALMLSLFSVSAAAKTTVSVENYIVENFDGVTNNKLVYNTAGNTVVNNLDDEHGNVLKMTGQESANMVALKQSYASEAGRDMVLNVDLYFEDTAGRFGITIRRDSNNKNHSHIIFNQNGQIQLGW